MHWSVEPDPASPSPPNASLASPAASERSSVEAIAELLEALFLKEPDLVTALLGELHRADIATLAKLFGVSVPADVRVTTELPIATEAPAKSGVIWTKPGAELIDLDPEEPVSDDRGYRLNPSRSVFPRNEPRGSHWSR